MIDEAVKMIAIVPPATSSEPERQILQSETADWSDLLRVVEDEVKKRRRSADILARELSQNEFKPEIGDIVTAFGQVGNFKVTDVDADQRSANLILVDYEFTVDSVPWRMLKLAKTV